MSASPHPGESALVKDLLAKVIQNGKALEAGQSGAREGIIASCLSLVSALENPSESIVRTWWAQPTHHVAVRIAIQLKIFDHLSEDNGSPKSSEQLAAMCSAEPFFISRMMKHLAAMGTIRELDVDSFAHTPLSEALRKPMYRDSVLFLQDHVLPVHVKAPQYFAERGYKSPTNGTDAPMQYTYNIVGSTLFDWFKQRPEIGEMFGNMMTGWSFDRPKWMYPHFYPITERLVDGAKKEENAVFLVDIGGGRGHDLENLKSKHPNLPGRLVLQEVPEVVSLTNLSQGLEVTVHDFNTPQPIHGARAYYLHNILHDWSDDQSRHILQQIVPAMEKGYSKVLINDYVVPDKGAPYHLTGLDWEMMSFMAAVERTELQSRTLIESAGLKVTGIWDHPQADQSLIEAELP